MYIYPQYFFSTPQNFSLLGGGWKHEQQKRRSSSSNNNNNKQEAIGDVRGGATAPGIFDEKNIIYNLISKWQQQQQRWRQPNKRPCQVINVRMFELRVRGRLSLRVEITHVKHLLTHASPYSSEVRALVL